MFQRILLYYSANAQQRAKTGPDVSAVTLVFGAVSRGEPH